MVCRTGGHCRWNRKGSACRACRRPSRCYWRTHRRCRAAVDASHVACRQAAPRLGRALWLRPPHQDRCAPPGRRHRLGARVRTGRLHELFMGPRPPGSWSFAMSAVSEAPKDDSVLGAEAKSIEARKSLPCVVVTLVLKLDACGLFVHICYIDG